MDFFPENEISFRFQRWPFLIESSIYMSTATVADTETHITFQYWLHAVCIESLCRCLCS